MTVRLHRGDLPDLSRYGREVAIDTETMGLDPHRDRLCVVQLSPGDGSADVVQIPQDLQRAPNLERLLTDPGVTKIFHYARFDIAVLKKRFGIVTGPVYCTKIASKLVRTYTDRHGLKDLVRELLNIDLNKQQQSSDWGAEKLSESQTEYAASDVLYLHDLKRHLDRMMRREGRTELADACFRFLPTRIELDLMGWSENDIFAHKLMATADTSLADGRAAIYRSLRRRNRFVAVLRIVVPLIGLMVLAVLGVQLLITHLTKDFTIGRVSLQRDRLVVEAPSYAGALGDGTIYTVTAATAEAAYGAPNLIDLANAELVVTTGDGVKTTATAPVARVDSDKQTVDVAGETQVSDSNGMTGTLNGLHIDSPGQAAHADGAIAIRFSGGETLNASSMRYDSGAKMWRFTGVTMMLPTTPGEKSP